MARPLRRSGVCWHSSASQRLYALAPASMRSGGSPRASTRPAPNGAPMLPVAASGPGKITSAVTPSLSSSLSRFGASQPQRSPPSCRLSSPSSWPNHSSWNSSSPPIEIGLAQLVLRDEPLPLLERLVERLAVLRVEELAVVRGLRAGVAVGRDDQVVLHGQPPGCQTFVGACRRNAMLAAPSGMASSPAITASTGGPNCAASGSSWSRSKP